MEWLGLPPGGAALIKVAGRCVPLLGKGALVLLAVLVGVRHGKARLCWPRFSCCRLACIRSSRSVGLGAHLSGRPSGAGLYTPLYALVPQASEAHEHVFWMITCPVAKLFNSAPSISFAGLNYMSCYQMLFSKCRPVGLCSTQHWVSGCVH